MERLSGPAEEARFITESGAAARVADLVEPVLASMGYRLVLVRLTGGNDVVLEIMAERADGTMTVEDCEAVSHAVSPLLDVHDPVDGSYRLQVSSPGIDRPLVRPVDFERWAGYEAKIELKEAVSGRKRFRGPLEGFAEGEARIEIEVPEAGRQVIGLPIDLIGSAKLVLTDNLVRESLRRAKGNETTDGKTDKPARKDARKATRRVDVTKVK